MSLDETLARHTAPRCLSYVQLGLVDTSVRWRTSKEPPEAARSASDDPVLLDRANHVFRACRGEATATSYGRWRDPLVEMDERHSGADARSQGSRIRWFPKPRTWGNRPTTITPAGDNHSRPYGLLPRDDPADTTGRRGESGLHR
jgi:hypothetical protein